MKIPKNILKTLQSALTDHEHRIMELVRNEEEGAEKELEDNKIAWAWLQKNK